MKKIGFITTNKVLAQSLAAAIKNYPDLGFEPCLLINPDQVLLDAEIQNIEIAVVDMTWSAQEKSHSVFSLCKGLHKVVPCGKIFLLVPQRDPLAKDIAMRAIKCNLADDYVFFDVSLDYLLTKLLAL
ncbi:MAG TPA: hypothetical protein DEQ02_08990 [Ruminococcaceae bacterium]|nr:hypothetical protein [Oscillospiraceae bacterium]